MRHQDGRASGPRAADDGGQSRGLAASPGPLGKGVEGRIHGDAAEPEQRFLRWGHGVYFGKVVPRIGGALSDPTAYRYLPKSLAYLPPPPEMTRQIEAAGFGDVRRVMLLGGIFQLWTATRR